MRRPLIRAAETVAAARSASMSQPNTAAPSRANVMAQLWPMPAPIPVINATLPANLSVIGNDRPAATASRAGSLAPLGGGAAFHLDLQFHFLLEAVLLAEVHAKIRAVESGRYIRAAYFLLAHRALHALEGIDHQRHGLRDAVHRQSAL